MKLAIIGSGMIVGDFLSTTSALPGVELVAIFGRASSVEKLEALQQQYAIGKIYHDYAECLADPEVDTVYIALPNHLHFMYAKDALLAGKHVICEKPFTTKLADFMELKQIAQERALILVEAITNQYLSNYKALREELPNLGDLKIVECNYSQYSSRYDKFLAGEVLPAFDPAKGGGALTDINIYNIHFVVGLLGKPSAVSYHANVERGIDTSGVLLLTYPTTQAVCIGAKDSSAPIRTLIQGNKGAIVMDGPTNTCQNYGVQMLREDLVTNDVNPHQHRMVEEFLAFTEMIGTKDVTTANAMLEHSQIVMEVLEAALTDAGIDLG